MKPKNHTLSNQLKRTHIFYLITILLCFSAQLTFAQTVRTVDNRPESGAQFTSVQDAINASSTTVQDIIYIHPSPASYGNITIDRPITLIGPGHNPANYSGLRATLGTIQIGNNTNPDTTNSIIAGLNFTYFNAFSWGSNSGGIQIINNRIGTSGIIGFSNGSGSPDWVIEGNYFDTSSGSQNLDIRGNTDWTIQNNVFGGRIDAPNRTTIITNNLFINNDTSGTATIFTSSNDITSPIVTNNMFIFTDPDVTEVINSGSTPIVYTNCLTWNEAEGASSDLIALPGSGNLDNTDPVFSTIPNSVDDFYNNLYTLAAGSPAIGTATDGGEIGVFGRGFPFDINGRPNSMPYPTEMTILNTVVQPGQNLNVTFKATQKN